jgi:hypothetical protein
LVKSIFPRVGKKAGTIPAYKVYGDYGYGMQVIPNQITQSEKVSRIVANEMVRTLYKTGIFKRLVITRIED